jgi:amino acid transporter
VKAPASPAGKKAPRDIARPAFRAELGTLDFTLLVIGAIVGADIYIVAAMGAQFLGPAQLVAWLAAGVLGALIALAFVQCAAIDPEVGGAYAYVRRAFGPMAGLIAGWALYLGEWVALPIFPLTFGNYLAALVPGLPVAGRVAAGVLLVIGITAINVFGTRASGRVNDVLTAAKLVPLVLLIAAGLFVGVTHPVFGLQRLTPFSPLGWGGFGPAVMVIFWAFAGFELAVLPASEVKHPGRTLPLGLVLGVGAATVCYLLVALTVVMALPWQTAAQSAHPLSDALGALLTVFGLPAEYGSVVMSLGALVSVAAVFDVFTLAVARLSYAMASDGLLPPPFARLHPKFGTPVAGLLFQGAAALVLSFVLDVTRLIDVAVFFLGLSYFATALAALRLASRHPDKSLRFPGHKVALAAAALSGLYLSSQAPHQLVTGGVAVLVLGLLLDALLMGPRRRASLIPRVPTAHEHRLRRNASLHERWLLRSADKWRYGRTRRSQPHGRPGL